MARASSGFQVRVDVRRAREALDRLSDKGVQGQVIGQRLLRATAEAVQGRASLHLRDNGTNLTFQLTRSWKIDGPVLGRSLWSVKLTNTAPYSAFVEFGTKARGAAASLPFFTEQMRQEAGYHYGLGISPLPPLDAIGRWVELRGLPDEATYPIARQIAREGIEPQPFLGPAVEIERRRARRRLKRAAEQLAS